MSLSPLFEDFPSCRPRRRRFFIDTSPLVGDIPSSALSSLFTDMEISLLTSFSKSGSSIAVAVVVVASLANCFRLLFFNVPAVSISSKVVVEEEGFQTKEICTPPVSRETLIATYLNCPTPVPPTP